MGKTEILLVHRHWLLEYAEFEAAIETEKRLRKNLKNMSKLLETIGLDYFVSEEKDETVNLQEASIWIKKKDEKKLLTYVMKMIDNAIAEFGKSRLIEHNKKNNMFNAFDLGETYRSQAWKQSKTRQITPVSEGSLEEMFK